MTAWIDRQAGRTGTFASGALFAAALLAAVVAVATPVQAGGAALSTGWIEAPHSRVRLVALAPEGGTLRAGVEIELEPGYKTYWRSPGDSGVPPQFSFSGSRHLTGLAASFPAPDRFPDGAGGTAWGYHDAVVFPITGRIESGAAGYRLVVGLDFAVCGTLCIPAHAEAVLDSDLASVADAGVAALLQRFSAQVPVPVAAGETAGNGLTLAPGPAQRKGRDLLLTVRAAGPGVAAATLFGESGGFIETLASRDGPDGSRLFDLRVEPAPGGRFGHGTMTLVGASGAIEVAVDLDAAAARP